MANQDTGDPIRVREATLPGVGVKYIMPLRYGGNLAVIVRPDGARQLYHFLAEEDRPCDVVKMDKEEAQQLANLLGEPLVSADPDPLTLALGGLELEWVELDEGSALVGQSLGEAAIRAKTGASVIAIMRGDEALANPDVGTRFEVGDTLLVIGSHEQCQAVRDLLQNLGSS